MPILPAEPEMYPSTLWQDDRPRTDQHRWWCLHTKPRQEKALARSLNKRLIAHYLPQVVSERLTPGGRKLRSMLLLFPGYVFLYGDEYQLAAATQWDLLANVLHVADQESFERDLRQLHRVLGSGMPVSPEPTHVVGTTIEIQSGPLKGVVGAVVRRDGKNRFTAVVRFLGKGATVELQDWQVKPVPQPDPKTLSAQKTRSETEPCRSTR